MALYLKSRFKLYIWHYADAFLAKLVMRVKCVPPHTWNAICEQDWLFSTRQEAQEKLGVAILYDVKKKKLVSRITRQVDEEDWEDTLNRRIKPLKEEEK